VLVVDANVLLYAVDESAVDHRSALRWLEEALAQAEPIAIAWVVVVAFLRISTSPSAFARPLTTDEALAALDGWLTAPIVIALEPTPRHLAVVAGLLKEAGTAGNLVNDTHLAALALEHGATVISYDNDFSRFAGVSWRKPA